MIVYICQCYFLNSSCTQHSWLYPQIGAVTRVYAKRNQKKVGPISSVQFSHSVMFNSLPLQGQQHTSFPAHHGLLELAQTPVHQVDDVIQPSHPQSSPSPPVFNLSQRQVFSKESVLHIRQPKHWSFSFSISPSNEYQD